MRSKQYFTSIKNNPHEISTDPFIFFIQPYWPQLSVACCCSLVVMQKISFLVVMATVLLHLHGFYLLRLECFLSTLVAKYLLLPMLSLKRCQGLQPQVRRFLMILSHCRMECRALLVHRLEPYQLTLSPDFCRDS